MSPIEHSIFRCLLLGGIAFLLWAAGLLVYLFYAPLGLLMFLFGGLEAGWIAYEGAKKIVFPILVRRVASALQRDSAEAS